MKKVFLITTLLLNLFLVVTAQTTQEEYNYVTKGYADQVEKGLDMKKGYSLVDYGHWGTNVGNEKRDCSFKGLIRQGQTKPCAIMMIYKRTDTGAIMYICIPSDNASDEIWNQTLTYIDREFSGTAIRTAVIWALMKFGSQVVTK